MKGHFDSKVEAVKLISNQDPGPTAFDKLRKRVNYLNRGKVKAQK